MLKLEPLHIWEKLSSPYGNSEEIPALLSELSKTYDKEIADELLWEYIYHQGSVYENTFATFPYLLKIACESDKLTFKLDIIVSLGVVLVDYDETSDLENIFEGSLLHTKNQEIIREAFLKAFQEFKEVVANSFAEANILEEADKKFLLATYLVTIRKHTEANIFINFSGNDEYVFICPHCKEETFLWNEDNILNAYVKDPVFHKEQKIHHIDIEKLSSALAWFEDLVHQIDITSLKPLLPYLKGFLACPHCGKASNVFEGIKNVFRTL